MPQKIGNVAPGSWIFYFEDIWINDYTVTPPSILSIFSHGVYHYYVDTYISSYDFSYNVIINGVNHTDNLFSITTGIDLGKLTTSVDPAPPGWWGSDFSDVFFKSFILKYPSYKEGILSDNGNIITLTKATVQIADVYIPEPSTIVLLGVGFVLLEFRQKRGKAQKRLRRVLHRM